MIKIVVGSNNPVKISAAKTAICDILCLKELECVGINAPSNVSDRVQYCQQHTQADFYVAIEGGVDQFEYGPATFAFVAIADQKNMSIGRSCHLPLPPVIYQALKSGEELGHVMDRLFNTDNVKQKQGAIGLLTNGLATRESVYRQAIILAMAPFIHPDLYTE
jgi:inosine/xanthosine triphosphatase